MNNRCDGREVKDTVDDKLIALKKVLQQHDLVYTVIARSDEEYQFFKRQGFKESEIMREFDEDK